jgi:hypothetical protein
LTINISGCLAYVLIIKVSCITRARNRAGVEFCLSQPISLIFTQFRKNASSTREKSITSEQLLCSGYFRDSPGHIDVALSSLQAIEKN